MNGLRNCGHRRPAARFRASLFWTALASLTFAVGLCSAQTENEASEACRADPEACLEQERIEFAKRGTLGLDLHPESDGETITWIVHHLDAGAAAEEGGLRRGDVLLRWNGLPPSTPEKPDLLKELVTNLTVDETVEIQVLRGLDTKIFTLQPRPADERTKRIWLEYFARQHFDHETIQRLFPEEHPNHRPQRGDGG